MKFSVGTFEGPLDLLLSLIRQEEMDIVSIDLQKITQQYLQVMEDNKEALSLDDGGEFIRMAAFLIYLKSKSLLPVIEEIVGEEDLPEISREALIEALLQHQHYLKAAENLNQRLLLNRDIWTSSKYSFVESDEVEAHIKGSVHTLFKTCYKLLRNLHTYRAQVVFPSVKEWLQKVKNYFVKGKEFTFKSLLKDKSQPMGHQIVLSLLTLLELSKMGFVSLSQQKNDIKVYTKKTLDEKTSSLDI